MPFLNRICHHCGEMLPPASMLVERCSCEFDCACPCHQQMPTNTCSCLTHPICVNHLSEEVHRDLHYLLHSELVFLPPRRMVVLELADGDCYRVTVLESDTQPEAEVAS